MNDDELLDKILDHLRNEPVPEMPPLAEPASTPWRSRPASRRWTWYVAAAAAIAAVAAGLWVWQLANPPLAPRGPEPRLAGPSDTPRPAAEIVVHDLNPAMHLSQLDQELNHLADEIAALRQQAALLDARQRAQELSLALQM